LFHIILQVANGTALPPFTQDAGEGFLGITHTERGLTWVTVDLAGHGEMAFVAKRNFPVQKLSGCADGSLVFLKFLNSNAHVLAPSGLKYFVISEKNLQYTKLPLRAYPCPGPRKTCLN
jgi:hypothetical protein